MKKWLILILVLVVLAGAGWWWWQTKLAEFTPPPSTEDLAPLPTSPVEPLFNPEVEGGGLPGGVPPANGGGAGVPPPSGSFTPVPQLWPGGQTLNQLTTEPVAGGYLWWSGGTTTPPTFIYLEPIQGKIIALEPTTNSVEIWAETDLTKINSVEFDRVGANLHLLINYRNENEEPKYWLATLSNAATSTRQLSGQLLTGNILTATLSPTNHQIFYLVNGTAGAVGWVTDWDLEKKTAVFESGHRGWVVSWVDNENVLLTTRAAASAPGLAYKLNTKTKNYERLLGPVNGLTLSLSPDGENLVSSESTAGGWRTRWQSGEVNREPPFQTWPEKCAWSPTETLLYCAVPQTPVAATYPDDWYAGEVTLNDEWWSLNLETGEARRLGETGRLGSFDAVRPQLAAPGLIHFINKRDLSWWLADWRSGL